MIPPWARPAPGGRTSAYLWGGTVIESNLALHRLWPGSGRTVLRFRWRFQSPLNREQPLRSTEVTTRAGEHVRVAVWPDGTVRYEIRDVGLYEIPGPAGIVEFFPSNRSDPMRVEHHLVNSILPLWAGLHGEICLHASAVSHSGRATLFAGPSGSGKSTRAMEEISRGALLLADDAVVLRRSGRRWLVFPGSRSLRLQESPAEASWKTGLKREAFLPSAGVAGILDELLLLAYPAPPLMQPQEMTILFCSLLALQAGWEWGDISTRRQVAELAWQLSVDLIGNARRSGRHEEPGVASGSDRRAGAVPHASKGLQDGRLV